MADNTNNPLLKLKEKKEQIHKPIIASPFNNNTDATPTNITPTDAAVIKEERSTNEPRENKRTDAAAPKEEQKKSNNIKYNLIIDNDILFTLKALANYDDEPINKTLSKALQTYYKTRTPEEIKEATFIYKKILELKGGRNGTEENNQ